jgi:hypothetical protein
VLTFPFGPPLQRAQPLVVLGNAFYARGSGDGPVTLVTAAGIRHPLQCLGPAEVWQEHGRRLNEGEVRTQLLAEAVRRGAGASLDPLHYLVAHLSPACARRDWGAAHGKEGVPTCGHAPFSTLAEELSAAARQVPLPRLPSPSLWFLGRVWPLGEVAAADGRTYVRWGSRPPLTLTDAHEAVGALDSEWRAWVAAFVMANAARLVPFPQDCRDCPALHQAHEEIGRTGCWQAGDLFYLPEPARLGCVVPGHYNRVLRCDTGRDLALVVGLTLPPTVPFPRLYLRGAGGRWEPYAPPNGLCLGNGPPSERPEDPGLHLAAYLRWAALRIAGNAKFHSADS